jgi:excinuclease UvrABC nuclease subunit
MVLKWIFKEVKMRNCVYRFLNKDNKVIYVGKAKDLKSRILNHKHLSEECYKERNKVEYVRFVSEDDMDFAERYYIMKFNYVFLTKCYKANFITLIIL